MGYVQGIASKQAWLLPYSIEELIKENNPVRVIEAYIDSLRLEELGFARAVPAQTGRPSYDPRDMLKLYLYGYSNRLRSSRRLMLECRRNVELFYLLGMIRPDFRTIADFRKDNRKAIEAVFKDFVQLCSELKLLGKKMFTVDGTKIRAVNSKKKVFTETILDNKLKYLEEQEQKIEQYLSEMDYQDQEEHIAGLDIKPEDMPAHLEAIRKRKIKYTGYKERMKQTKETQILETDPECRSMKTKEGIQPCYNVQTVVDDDSHIITGFKTTNANTDQGLLSEMAKQTKEELGIETAEFKADKGYESREDILKCIMNGSIPDVGFKYDKEYRFYDLEYIPAEITEEIRQSTKPEDIQTCIHAGILPACYEGSAISIELQKKSVVSCFIRHEDGTVTCPVGRQLFKHRDRKHGTVYGSREACRTCPNRCTNSKAEKQVSIGYNTNVVFTTMYGMPHVPLQKPPPGAVPHNNFNLKKPEARVRLTIRRDPDLMQKRKEVVEHPFGTIKWYDGAHYFLCRGEEMVSAEIALSFLSYNLRRAINILGVGVLIARIKERKRKIEG